MRRIRASQNRIQGLLDTLCVELGFCIPPEDRDAIVADPPMDAGRFAERVFRAEGMEPRDDRRLYAQVRERAARVLDDVRFMRVAWPDGSIIAEVDVSPICNPIHTTHVVGTFERGPGFDRLAPHLEEMNRLVRDGQLEAAFRVSERMDGLDITAIDDLGRVHQVFNLVFAQGGLLFAVAGIWRPNTG